ncbi:MAG: hypothetical protein WCH34_06880, partial [Bacteroidota bacterium]
SNQITGLQFSKMYGYLGQLTFTAQDTFLLDIFENNYSNYFEFNDMKAKIYTWNSVGMPVNYIVNQLYGASSVNPPYMVNVSCPTLFNPLLVPYPSLSQFGQSHDTIYVLNSANSNILQVMSISPKKFIYNITGTTNPLANPAIPNFILDTSRFGTKLKIEVPLWGKIKGFVHRDTISFHYNRVDELESILLRVNATNGFPVDAHIQLYFADSVYTIKDSLLNPYQQMILAAQSGPAPDLKVQTPTNKITDIVIDGTRLKALDRIKYIIVKSELWSYDYTQSDIKIYMDYALDLKIGAKVKFKYNYHQ